MTTTSSSGLEVLLSTLQNAGDIESMLNILNVLDELLSAGTDRRIHYMISKGGSEALLAALVNTARTLSPNYTVLLPLLHLLAKVGQRDRRIGMKAEEAEAVLLTLKLLKQNGKHARRAAACLWVLKVYCSSVTTANLLGENQCLDVIFNLISPHTTNHHLTIKAAIDALAALLCSKANVHSAVAKGFVGGLLGLYEDWHTKDPEHQAVSIRRALLRCLNQATHCRAGRQALVTQGGIALLYHTTQSCLMNKGLEFLVEAAVQLMRKCCPKSPLPLTSDQSVYNLPLPGRPFPDAEADLGSADVEGSDDDDDGENEESDCKEYDDDLETDLNQLRNRPEPDRPLELLGQYVHLCPELSHKFQELESGSEPEESSSDEELLKGSYLHQGNGSSGGLSPASSSSSASPVRRQNSTREAPQLAARDFHSGGCAGRLPQPGQGSEAQGSVVERLLEQHGACIPHHDPRLYRAAASATKSIPGYSILAFPDFWGHLPPPHLEPMVPRKPKVQRQKVFEDIRRLLQPEDILDQVVFDLEEPKSVNNRQCVSDRSDSLRFFSKFESGNLRKAIQVRRYEYDLILNADANCRQHTQWFYFEVSGMAPGVPYRFNVVNCEKGNSQFNYGMQPVLYSVREALEGRPQWVRSGTEICYYRNSFWPSRGRKRSSFYTLTFTITFKHNEDVCYLAYHYPYTFSALQSHLQGLQCAVDPSKVFFRQQSLCHTLGGNPCPLVTITACPPSRSWKDLHQLRNRPCLVLSARVHPGESNASWVMKGTLEFLCGSSPVAQSLREAFVFKILPMLNPDGVVNGTHRCALNGADLNRQWMKPDPVLSPTIYHAKGFLYYLNSIGRTPLVFCDYHGHSRKKNVFLYGCSVKETLWQSGSAVSTAGLKEDPGYRTIPKTLDRLAPAFSFNSCNYQVEKSRSATARVVVWREMGVLRSYTMESTYNGCDQGIYKGLQIGTQGLEEMGLKFCQSLLSLQRNTNTPYNRRLINHIDLDDSLLDHKSHNSFEDDEPPCVEEIEYTNGESPETDGTALDSDVNGNTSSAEEDEGEESTKGKRITGRRLRHSQLFPDRTSKSSRDTLKSSCNGRNISSGHYLS